MNSFINYINLHNGEENKQKVLENVTSNISFRGSNLWILACAIFIASVGLNLNSTAVIIGAMLISPLMGPIVGAGFGLGIFDFNLLRRSLFNLFIATLVSLIVSATYFYISPFKEIQSELLARTYPTIYDVLIAFFGGLVGVIAITRVEKGNPIPGVAIATALMPPLCTAGYGIAMLNLNYFFGAMFLYLINCVFICIATFFIVKYLKYPPIKELEVKHEKFIRYSITLIILLMILPSTYLAYNLYNEKKFSNMVEIFLFYEFTNKGLPIIYKDIKFNSNPKLIELAILNKKFTQKELSDLKQQLPIYNISNTEIIVKQDTTDIKNIIIGEIAQNKKIIDTKDIRISELENYIADNCYNNSEILKEVRILFPEIFNLSLANHSFNNSGDSLTTYVVMLYKSNNEINPESINKLRKWLQEKLKKEKILIHRFETNEISPKKNGNDKIKKRIIGNQF